ncbi:MAG: hypothetical protein WDO06_04980 [Actinomycetota bacterium]
MFVFAGTSDVQAREGFEDAVFDAGMKVGTHATPAYVTGKKDLLSEVLGETTSKVVIPMDLC